MKKTLVILAAVSAALTAGIILTDESLPRRGYHVFDREIFPATLKENDWPDGWETADGAEGQVKTMYFNNGLRIQSAVPVKIYGREFIPPSQKYYLEFTASSPEDAETPESAAETGFLNKNLNETDTEKTVKSIKLKRGEKRRLRIDGGDPDRYGAFRPRLTVCGDIVISGVCAAADLTQPEKYGITIAEGTITAAPLFYSAVLKKLNAGEPVTLTAKLNAKNIIAGLPCPKNVNLLIRCGKFSNPLERLQLQRGQKVRCLIKPAEKTSEKTGVPADGNNLFPSQNYDCVGIVETDETDD